MLKTLWKRYGLFLIISIGFFVRIYRLGSIPPGLNQDEASIGYDAWSILNYGIDRNNYLYPIHLVSFGSGQTSLYAYLSMPFIALFGLTPLTLRIIQCVFNCLSLIVFYQLIKELFDKRTATIALFFLVINPWHIMISKWALDCNLFPALFLTGFYFLIKSITKQYNFYIAMLCFGLCLYTYGTAYFFVPFFLLFSLPYLIRYQKIKPKTLMYGLIFFSIIILPIFLYILINFFKHPSIRTLFFSIPSLSSVPRHNTVSILFQQNFIQEIGKNLLIFTELIGSTQNDNLLWNVIPKYGFMYLFSLPLLIYGLVYSIVLLRKNQGFSKFFLIFPWILGSLMIGVLTYVNINRINIIFLPIIIFLSIAASHIKKVSKYLFIILVVLYSIYFSSFVQNYFDSYPSQIGVDFFESFDEAINYSVSQNPHSIINITNHVNMPYIYVLFYTKTPPNKFIQTVQYLNPGASFVNVRSFDRYVFGIDPQQIRLYQTFIFRNGKEEYFSSDDFILTRFKNFSVAQKKSNYLQ